MRHNTALSGHLKRTTLGLYSSAVRLYRRVIPRRVRLPGFIIIGVMKGDTTSLYYALRDRQAIALALTKQIHYFDFNYGKRRNRRHIGGWSSTFGP